MAVPGLVDPKFGARFPEPETDRIAGANRRVGQPESPDEVRASLVLRHLIAHAIAHIIDMDADQVLRELMPPWEGDDSSPVAALDAVTLVAQLMKNPTVHRRMVLEPESAAWHLVGQAESA